MDETVTMPICGPTRRDPSREYMREFCFLPFTMDLFLRRLLVEQTPAEEFSKCQQEGQNRSGWRVRPGIQG
jgi:hypothetical protein